MSIVSLARTVIEPLLSLVYPPHCANCGGDVACGEHLCEPCRNRARRIVPPFCSTCSQPFDGAIDGTFICANCEQRNLHFDCAVAAFRSRGVVREFIHRFKYQRQFHLRHPLVDWLAAGLDDPRMKSQPIDAFVPVPLHPARQREREFNQAGVIASLVGRRIGIPVADCLRRIRYTTTQTRFDRIERMENLRNAFELRHSADVRNKHLVLVDDVLTTGATVDECARVLRKAGTASIRVITVARG